MKYNTTIVVTKLMINYYINDYCNCCIVYLM